MEEKTYLLVFFTALFVCSLLTMSIWFIAVFIFTILNLSQLSEALFCRQYRKNVEISFEEFSYELLKKSFTFSEVSSDSCAVSIFVNYHKQILEILLDVGHEIWFPKLTKLAYEQLTAGYDTVTSVSIVLYGLVTRR
jgi:hypothetical protein